MVSNMNGEKNKETIIVMYKNVKGIEKIDINEYLVPRQSSSRIHGKRLAYGIELSLAEI